MSQPIIFLVEDITKKVLQQDLLARETNVLLFDEFDKMHYLYSIVHFINYLRRNL